MKTAYFAIGFLQKHQQTSLRRDSSGLAGGLPGGGLTGCRTGVKTLTGPQTFTGLLTGVKTLTGLPTGYSRRCPTGNPTGRTRWYPTWRT